MSNDDDADTAVGFGVIGCLWGLATLALAGILTVLFACWLGCL